MMQLEWEGWTQVYTMQKVYLGRYFVQVALVDDYIYKCIVFKVVIEWWNLNFVGLLIQVLIIETLSRDFGI